MNSATTATHAVITAAVMGAFDPGAGKLMLIKRVSSEPQQMILGKVSALLQEH
ncbi:hypothetical protein [Kineococcus rhizosphaerae]|uniref:hypothetical protein n=1 Tax=Kineococcus rhizosphaerae TaxID=559628 RepID=UPI001473FA79|nr:hypothetical protein [Kineococcus rhizosphaerae]